MFSRPLAMGFALAWMAFAALSQSEKYDDSGKPTQDLSLGGTTRSETRSSMPSNKSAKQTGYTV